MTTSALKSIDADFILSRDDIWRFEVNASSMPMNTWSQKDGASSQDCGYGGPLEGTLRVDYSRATSASPRTTAKESQDIKLHELTTAVAGKPMCDISANFTLDAASENMNLALEMQNQQKKTCI
jgi:hypothetical protein